MISTRNADWGRGLLQVAFLSGQSLLAAGLWTLVCGHEYNIGDALF
jgi:hypothetical protein